MLNREIHYRYFAFLNPIRNRIWAYAMGSTLLISIAPFAFLSVIPIQVCFWFFGCVFVTLSIYYTQIFQAF